MRTKLTTAAREIHDLTKDLTMHIDAAKKEETRLRNEIFNRRKILELSADGIETDKVALAKRIIAVGGLYSKGGRDRASVISDAIQQLSTGKPVMAHYGDLRHVYFGTKNYSEWVGQRSDHEYGYGPRHGGIVFSVGLTADARNKELSPEEIEAAIYYLTNLGRVQEAEQSARAKAGAA